MEESIVETKPVINVETKADSTSDANVDKTNSPPIQSSIDHNLSTNSDKMEATEQPIPDPTEELRTEAEDKMEVEPSPVETSTAEAEKDSPQITVQSDQKKVEDNEDSNSHVLKNVNNDNEVSVAVTVEDTNGVEKTSEPVAEPVPEVAAKSPQDVVSAPEKITSPTPVPSATPPRSQTNKKPKVDLTSVPVRQYLDTTVVPILLQGLSSLARERPAKPISYLGNFLLEKASEYDED